ncbi:hypothetical protein FNF27_03783 [Cafeteria roenbergensis]|uniref:Uncharacterized protein n=1 Tax=Cafeteria roenbergensis TaxID=33653 RepID=A0A5A8EFC7_CAFRO|nr:hypothetical protein FNF29_06246 [Cafeteria roenbergensis]KAA0174660.1 hypothetical protein FNF27_03783 [Cafeteria roenbergensis]|eukprot:KAA0148962.1 hypothetical protein FNF29_06246 [Cafeteria roenbergensis]
MSVTTASSWTLPSLGPEDGSAGSGDMSALGIKAPLRGAADPIAAGLLALDEPCLVAPPARSTKALDQALLDADVALAGVSTDGEDGSSVRVAAL